MLLAWMQQSQPISGNEAMWVTIVGLVVTNLVTLATNIWNRRSNAPLVQAQAEGEMSKSYSLLLASYAPMIDEVKQLRPLVLRVNELQKELEEVKQDKDEWKSYARRLIVQLQKADIAPEPFQQLPSESEPLIVAYDKQKQELEEKKKSQPRL